MLSQIVLVLVLIVASVTASRLPFDVYQHRSYHHRKKISEATRLRILYQIGVSQPNRQIFNLIIVFTRKKKLNGYVFKMTSFQVFFCVFNFDAKRNGMEPNPVPISFLGLQK